MSNLTFSKTDVSLWTGASGSLDIDVKLTDPTKPVVCGGPVFSSKFNLAGSSAFGGSSEATVQLSFDANTSVTLAPICPNDGSAAPDLDQEFNVSGSLDPGKVAITLDVGGQANVSAASSFRYGVLQAGAELKAGADARWVCVRPYPATQSLQSILTDFFSNLALPGTVKQSPAKGELYSLEIGGYLQFGVNASAGYSISGTAFTNRDLSAQTFNLGDLKLSEAYDLSIFGKLSVTGRVAGRYNVQVQAGAKPGWANVRVFRKRTSDLQFAADLQLGASSQIQGLPQSGKEFLGALLGVNAKNWLNMIDDVLSQLGTVTSGADLEQKLDGLADIFVSRLVNKAIGSIAANSPELTTLMNRLKSVVDSYQNLDNAAISLFDRYFNIATLAVDSKLTDALNSIKALTTLKDIQGDVDPVLWNVLQQLTNGNPLTAILEDPIAAVQKKVDDTLALIQDKAHAEIRRYIALAKSEFGLDPLFDELAKFDSVANLQAHATDVVQHLVQRLIGKALSAIPPADLQKILNVSKQIADGTAAFWKHFDDALAAASSQSFSLEVNSVWERSDETTALIDVEINLQQPKGLEFIRAAGVGDFSKILANYNPQVVTLNRGSLTHDLQSSSGVKINIVGWHLNFEYQDSFKVLTHADQQILPSAAGRLNVFTTIDMQAERQTRRTTTKAEEQVHTIFTLRFLAETNNIIDGSKFDAKHKQYLIDVITGYDASYNSSFTDSNTTPPKLADALRFAQTLGLDASGATEAGLAPVLELKNGSFGPINAEYRVLFTPESLEQLFTTPISGDDIRSILKRIVLANYVGKVGLEPIGWMYANDAVRDLAMSNQNGFINAGTILSSANIKVEIPIPGLRAPSRDQAFDTTTSPPNAKRSATVALFVIEDELIDAFASLQKLVKTAKKSVISARDLTKCVNKFGQVLNKFDNMALGDNTTFAVMDGLIQLATSNKQLRSSALDLTTQVQGAERHIVFQLQAGQAQPPLAPRSKRKTVGAGGRR